MLSVRSRVLAVVLAAAAVSHAFAPPVSTIIIRATTITTVSTTLLHQSSDTEALKQAMLRNPSQSKDILIFQMYEDWRDKHNKGEFDANRFMEFKSNYLQLQKNYEREVAIAKRERRDLPPPLELNQYLYADLTVAEYHRLLQVSSDDAPPSSRTTVRTAYWEDEIDETIITPKPTKKVAPRTSLEPRITTTGGTPNPKPTSEPPKPTPPRASPRRRRRHENSAAEELKQAMLRNPSQSKDIMIYQMYHDWRQRYNKGEFDTNRFMEFKSNYMLMNKNYEKSVALAKMERREPPSFPEINEYADLTEAEYHRALMDKDKPTPTVPVEDSSTKLKDDDDNDMVEPPRPKKKAPPRTSIKSSSRPNRNPTKDEAPTRTPKAVAGASTSSRRLPSTSNPTEDLKQAMLRNPSQSKDIMIYQIYEDWRKKHNKGEFDIHRFMEFKSNYMRMQQNHQRSVAIATIDRQPPPPPPEVNEYADMTKAQYHRSLKGKEAEVVKVEETEEAREAPQVIVWGSEGSVSTSKKTDGIRASYVRRTKRAVKAMPPITVAARDLDGVGRGPGSAAQQRRDSRRQATHKRSDSRRQPNRSFPIRSSISKGSSPLSVDNRGPDADRMAVDFPERNVPAARGVPRRSGISDQETRIPLSTVDPSSSYARHNKVDLQKLPSVRGVSDQETKLPPKRVSTEYYTQAPKTVDDDSGGSDQKTDSPPSKVKSSGSSYNRPGVSSDQETKLPLKRVSTDFYTQSPKKGDSERTPPGVSDQEIRSPPSNVDPSASYAVENKKGLRKMSAVPHIGSSGSLSRQPIDPSVPYSRGMTKAWYGVPDHERRVPSDVVDTDPYSQARGRPSRFSANQGTPKSLGGKRSFRVSPESLSDRQEDSDESSKQSVSPDQNARAPSECINPDSIHAGHWPL